MRISVTRNNHTVEIEIEGHSTQKLAAAEATALRLLDAAPTETPAAPFGFSATPRTARADTGG
ncbi:hypothetical protein [Streptomyces sp. NPDC058394]|uniref:hypothetical protein n=1 Tax=Streptomyces sp. NPDC058394 TaxID=3346477 RepID=UPI00365DB202